MKTAYLQIEKEDITDNVIVVGDPERIILADSFLDEGKMVNENREYSVYTGKFRGEPVSLVATGIGAPSLAIALEELATLGVEKVLRAGTAMSINAGLGTFVVSTGAIRGEGTSDQYLPEQFPAIPDMQLANNLVENLQSSDLSHHYGLTATYDSFYSIMAPLWVDKNRKEDRFYRVAKENGALSMDMETSLLFVLSSYLGIESSSLCLVTNLPGEPENVLSGSDRKNGEENLIEISLKTLTRK